MDSKPIAVILAITLTIGGMAAVGITVTNVLSGTSSVTDLLPKTIEVISVNSGLLEANVQFTNQGSGTLQGVTARLEIDGKYSYPLIVKPPMVSPYKTLLVSGSATSGVPVTTNVNGITSPNGTDGTTNWDVFPGESVLLRVSAGTTSGDLIEKLYRITVK